MYYKRGGFNMNEDLKWIETGEGWLLKMQLKHCGFEDDNEDDIKQARERWEELETLEVNTEDIPF